jgi:alpha-1,2-mannosyltransferase
VTGIALGVTAAIKITPILLIVYFLLRRRWRSAIVSVLTAAALALLSLFYIGGDQLFRFATVIFPAISAGTSDYSSMSFNAFWSRLFLPPDMLSWLNLEPEPNLIGIKLLTWASSAILIAVVGALLIRHRGQPALEYSLVLAVVLIISPVLWWHYLVWLVIGVSAFLSQRESGNIGKRDWLLFAVSVISMNISPDWLYRLADSLAKSSVLAGDLWMSVPLLGLLLFVVILLFSDLRQQHESR